jgi:hypothetical protein
MKCSIFLTGGLGNLMFQIATGETWRQRGFEVYYTNMDDNLEFIANNFVPKRNASEYKGLFPNFDWDKWIAPEDMKWEARTVDFHINNIKPRAGIEFHGYFQSETNFLSHEFVKWLFKPNEAVREMLSLYSPLFTGTTCSIHVRRQDYLKLAHYHTNLTMDYYNKAMWTLEPFKVDKYLIFSDDITWCMENFKGDKFRFVQENEYMTMFLMGMCSHNIIANSSLSWMGAYLGEHQDKVIVAPKNWFGIAGPQKDQIVPQRWIKY